MNKKPELYRVQIPIYRDTLQFFFGSREDAIEAVKADNVPAHIAESIAEGIREEESKGVYLYNNAERYHLIWMPEVPRIVDHYATLVHELQHFVFRFLDLRGFEHTDASDEAYSYLLGYVYGEIEGTICDIKSKEKEEKAETEEEPQPQQ